MTLVQPFAGVAGAQSEFTGEVSIFANSATDGSTSYYDLADPSGVENYSVQLTGEETTQTESESATSIGSGETLPLPIAGTEAPRNETVTFTGVEQTRGAYWTGSNVGGGDTGSLEVTGNQPPTNATVMFTGDVGDGTWTRKSFTGVGDGHSGTVSVNGVASTHSSVDDPTINVTGSTNSAWDNESATYVETTESQSISVGGNTAPTGPSANGNPTLTVTARNARGLPYPGFSDYLSKYITNEYSGQTRYTEWEFNKPPDSCEYVDVYITGSAGMSDETLDIYLAKDDEPDQNDPTEGTKVVSSYAITGNTGWQRINFDTTVDCSATPEVTLQFVPSSVESGDYWKVRADGRTPNGDTMYGRSWSGDAAGRTESTAAKMKLGPVQTPKASNVAVSTDGTTTTLGDFTDGQTKTVELRGLSTMGSTLDFSGEGDGTLNYTLNVRENTKTTDASATLNGQTQSIPGTLADGETRTLTFSNSDVVVGENTVSVSLPAVSSDAPAHQATYEASIKDAPGSTNPAVDVGNDGTVDAQYDGTLAPNETATVSLSNLQAGTQTLAFGGSNATYDWRIEATEHAVTENPSLDIDGDGTTDSSVSGQLQPGEVATTTPDIALGSHSPTVSTDSWSETGVTVQYTEVTHSQNPSVVVNGREFAHEGTLGPNETASVNVTSDALTAGENEVLVRVGQSLAADAPTPQVTMDYYHTASVTHESRYDATAWTEERWLNHTYVDNRTDASLRVDMHDSVVSIKQVEISNEPGNYSRVLEENYNYDNGSLYVSLGDVRANETVYIHVRAQRMKVRNGSVTVTDPTEPGNALNSKISVDSRGEDFAIGVQNHRVLDGRGESWSDPSESARITADGRQWLRLPNAQRGSSARIAYAPLEVHPERGDAVVSIEDLNERTFSVDPGQTSGDTVRYVWVDTVEDQRYTLYSLTNQDAQTTSKATTGGVVLVDDDGSETFSITSPDSGSVGTPLGGDLEIVLIIAAVAGAFIGLYYAMNRWSNGVTSRRDWALIGVLTLIVGSLAIETVAPGTIGNLLRQAIVSVTATVLLGLTGIYFVSQYIPGGRRLRLAFIGVGVVLITVISAEAISPGFIGDLAPALDPVVRLGGIAAVAIIGYAAYRYLSGDDSGGSDNANSSGTSTTRVVIDDESGGD